MVFANKDDIRFVEVSPKQFHSSKTTIVVKKLDDVAALDYFLAKNKVCWTEISSAVIRCSEVDPEKKGKVDKEIIVSDGLLKPEGKNSFFTSHNRVQKFINSRNYNDVNHEGARHCRKLLGRRSVRFLVL